MSTSSAPSPSPAGRPTFFQRLRAGIEHPKDAVTSTFLSPKGLLIWRSIVLVYGVVIVGLSIAGWAETHYSSAIYAAGYLFYYTHFNWYSLLAYYAMTVYFGYKYQKLGAAMTVSPVTANIHTLLHNLNSSNHPLVVTVYWIFLSKGFANGTTMSRITSMSMHGITLVLVLSELVLGRMTMNWIALVPVLVVILLYAAWAILYHLMGGYWVYSFLDWSKPAAAFMYPGVLLATLLFAAIMIAVHKLRDRVFGIERGPAVVAARDVEMKPATAA
ncbi:hypothetical protein GGF32_007492 [Allomyces javanicus]|nr:hypothetical protein GGF32_007492 [Allomyces javanicus]